MSWCAASPTHAGRAADDWMAGSRREDKRARTWGGYGRRVDAARIGCVQAPGLDGHVRCGALPATRATHAAGVADSRLAGGRISADIIRDGRALRRSRAFSTY